MGFRADARAAVVSFLEDYAADDPTPGIPNSKMQVYPGRPASINPPTGFVDSIRGTIDYTGPIKQQLTYIVDAMRDWSRADIAFMNSGGIRSNLRAGDLIYADIFEVSPFDK